MGRPGTFFSSLTNGVYVLGLGEIAGRPDLMVSRYLQVAEAAAATPQPATCKG